MEIRKYRQAAGMTVEQLANKIGVTRSAVTLWENGKREPGFEYLVKLADTFRISMDDLLDYHPASSATNIISLRPPVDPAETVLLGKYRKMNSLGKTMLDAQADFLLARKECVSGEDNKTSRAKPIIQLFLQPTAAGYDNPVLNEDYVEVELPDDAPKGADFCVNVSGDSMEPYIHDKQRVYVKRQTELEDGDVGIFYLDGGIYCKQYAKDDLGNVYLLSANTARMDANKTIWHDSDSEFRCYGKVLLPKRLPMPQYF